MEVQLSDIIDFRCANCQSRATAFGASGFAAEFFLKPIPEALDDIKKILRDAEIYLEKQSRDKICGDQFGGDSD